ncbi:MAG: NAD(P)H-dependent oxidoreductase subunit E [Peptococcaceae bacterium]|nr:NAD(P)H-dependent oxidoreductase subunit E [Peptococcaceae bacterium]
MDGNTCTCQSEKFKQLEKIIETHKNRPGALIPVMHEAQDLFGHLPFHVQAAIAEGLNVPLADVYGVATFYSKFTLQAKGTYQINVCLGTACYVKGAQAVLDKIADTLHIKVGETTSDGVFSLDATRCIGACGLAPVMTINDKVFGELDADKVEKILHEYLELVWGDDKNADTEEA